jgi:hypothetical protein
MSNRFAWAWKLCSLGYSVALVSLGFLRADEMTHPFNDEDEWVRAVQKHGTRLFADNIWNQDIRINGAILKPLIRSSRQPLGFENRGALAM